MVGRFLYASAAARLDIIVNRQHPRNGILIRRETFIGVMVIAFGYKRVGDITHDQGALVFPVTTPAVAADPNFSAICSVIAVLDEFGLSEAVERNACGDQLGTGFFERLILRHDVLLFVHHALARLAMAMRDQDTGRIERDAAIFVLDAKRHLVS